MPATELVPASVYRGPATATHTAEAAMPTACTCPNCGTAIPKPRRNQTYCSGACRFSVADPRAEDVLRQGVLGVNRWGDTGCTVTSRGFPLNGAFAVADPRPAYLREGRDHYHTAGMYGVLPYGASSGAVNANACHDNGIWSVADPRLPLPAPEDRLACVIIAEDSTWHRPFTTLELAALQTMLDPEEEFEPVALEDGRHVWRRRRAEPWMLAGTSDSRHRECIGNAVPSGAAEAIASTMGHTLLLAWTGQTFVLSNTPIWVLPPLARIQRDLAIALSVASNQPETSHA